MIKLLIADDNVSFCESLFGVLTKEKDFKVTGIANNWKDIERKYFETQPDFLLLDLKMPEKTGLDIIKDLTQKEKEPKKNIIVMSGDIQYRASLTNVEKVRWVMAKPLEYEKLIDVIEETMAGEHIFPDKTPSVKLGLADSSELTAKEIEVLRLVCEGLEYSEIAERMHISQRTVKFHISNILSKTGYANKTRLAIAVTNKNFIIPSSPEKNPSSW